MSKEKPIKYEIVQIINNHIDEVIDIHITSFPGFFLTDLGKEVLRVFYQSLLEDKSTIFYGVRINAQLVGFFVASKSPKSLYTKLFFKNILRFTVPLAFSFLKNLNLLKRMYTSFTSSNKYYIVPLYSSSLLSICVSPAHAGKGVGKILLNKLEKELIFYKNYGYYLTTDAENNYATNHFYLTLGFKLYDTYNQGNRLMNIYAKELK
jgi:ribosomal protein S18 acetylase RimI-like enzyme